jgi:glutathione S-transferase
MMPRLVTITFSHYCEKARWALDRARIPYIEDAHLPLFAWLPALRAGRKRTVPSLCTADGAITDSTDILHWCDARSDLPPLFPPNLPEVAELEDYFDRVLGPHARRLAYHHILPSMRARIESVRGVPRREVVATRLFAPAVAALMRRGLRIDEPGVQRSLERIEEVLADVDRRLADGRSYLVGDRFTAADLTFAALATPLLAPPQLADFIPMDDPPAGLVELQTATRARPAGMFAMRLYAEERGRPGATAAAA